MSASSAQLEKGGRIAGPDDDDDEDAVRDSALSMTATAVDRRRLRFGD